jgi:hypothetical protein
MSVNLRCSIGTVNYTDWLHVTASKVSSPTVTAWETWIKVPFVNDNFVIPNLDPENYFIRYYDAPTNGALGQIRLELIANALTSSTIYERRFYTTGGSNTGDPIDGGFTITDPYLINKNVIGLFKEGFRYLKPTVEYNFIDAIGQINKQDGISYSTGEVAIVDVKYSIGDTAPALQGGLYSAGILNVTQATKTILAADINKKVRCVGSIATQFITLPSLASIATGDGLYFDNTCGGVAIQVKILLPGSDRIQYNGFMAASDLFAEFWVSKGEHLKITKIDANYWNADTDYKGVCVGERYAAGYLGMPGTIPEDSITIYDGDELGRVWWWINNVLPSTHVITDDAVITAYTHPADKVGLFVKHSTLKKFRTPNTQDVSERGLYFFEQRGIDGGRPYDYPGGFQNEMILLHGHPVGYSREQNGQKDPTGYIPLDASAPLEIHTPNTGAPNTVTSDLSTNAVGGFGGGEQRVKNIGVIFVRRI